MSTVFFFLYKYLIYYIGTLLSNCKSTSYLQKNRVKRSMFASKTDFDVSNDNINRK